MKSPTANRRVRPIIRVFVSSTFSDLVYERNALQQHVWPVLEQLCLKHGFQFHAIDLRWGVSTEAGLDHRTMRICFEELRRSQEISPEPNFLILLGNRYGWRPLPEEISQEEFDRLVVAAKSGSDGRQPLPGTHGKSAEDVLNEWYRCDKNVLVPTDPVAAHDCTPLNYILQPRTQHLNDGRDYTRTTEPRPADTQDWLDVQQVLWSIINTAFAVTDAGSAESGTTFEHRFDDIDWPRHIAEVHAREHPKRAVPQIVRFQGSATEQEIWCGTLSEPNAQEHVLAFVREIDNLPTAPRLAGLKNFVDLDPAGQIDAAAQQALNRLKQALRDRLGKNHVETKTAQLIAAVDENKRPIVDQDQQPSICITASHIEMFWKDVLARLTPLVQKQIDDYWRQTNLPDTESRQPAAEQRTARELEIERDEHLRFGRERGPKGSFVGRQDQLQCILDYINGDSSQPLVIHGASGCGKTALLARAVEDIPESKRPIVRFIGVTPRSSDVRSLLRSLCQELRQRNPIGAPLPSDIRELIDEFRKHLQAATTEQPVILFLDALDQLAESDNGRQLTWIPFGQLPSHVKIVVTCLSDRDEKDLVSQPFIAFQRRKLSTENMVNLDALPFDDAKTLLFDRWLRSAGRTVTEPQRRLIEQRLHSEPCRQPLYLKLLFEEAKLWRSYDKATEPGDRVPALLEQLFDRLSQPEQHGESLVKFVLGYIAAARRGLSETEILEVLFADPDYKQQLEDASQRNNHTLHTEPPRIPIAIWSRLRSDLAPYLTERAAPGGNVLTLYHRQVAEWVKITFLTNATWEPHRKLADFLFRGRRQSARIVDELPWQLAISKDWDRLLGVLSDLAFVDIAWHSNKNDVKTYWGLVEQSGLSSVALTYTSVVKSPQHYTDRIHFVISRLLEESGYPRESLSIQSHLCDRFFASGDMYQYAIAIGAKAGILADLAEFDKALQHYARQEEVCRSLGDQCGLQGCLGNQGLIHVIRGEHDIAWGCYRQQESICVATGNDYGLRCCLENQGVLLLSKADFAGARERLTKAIELCELLNDRDGLANCLGNLAEMCIEEYEFEEALEYLNKAEHISVELNAKGRLVWIAGNRGYASLLQGRLSTALRQFQEQKRQAFELGFEGYVAHAIAHESMILRLSGMNDEARQLANKCREIQQRTGTKLYASRIERALR